MKTEQNFPAALRHAPQGVPKNLIFLGGTMGVGKTAAARALQKRLPGCAMLDGDWCWDIRPFVVNEETKAMVTDNILHQLRAFLRCSAVQNIVFCWVMHEQSIIDGLLEGLAGEEFRFWNFSLTCTEEALAARLRKDVAAGIREADVIGRSLPRLPLYERVASRKVDVSFRTAEQAAELIAAFVGEEPLVEAVVFDMDGLLFDTERLCIEATDWAGEQMGIGKAGWMNYRTLGSNHQEVKRIWLAEFGPDFDYDRLSTLVGEYTRRYLAEHPIPVKPGLYELLNCLKGRGIPLAVASSSGEGTVRRNLIQAGVLDCFDAVVCGDHIARSKPAPDIYLAACAKLGTDPARCAAVEDSRNGLWSAANAGCYPLMVPDLWQPDAQTAAFLAGKANTLSDLIPWFAAHISPKVG